MSTTTVFLVNPASANGATGRRWAKLRRRAEAAGLRGETLVSQRPGHLTELAASVAEEGVLLVVVGGDGTLNEVANGAALSGAEIAVIPAGTGRDFGRTFGIPRSFDMAVEVALNGATRTIDLGRSTVSLPGGGERTRLFANSASVGMSGAVASRANTMSKRLGGRITFYAALVSEFARWRNTEMTVSFEQGARRGLMNDVVVANGRYIGGGMKIAPTAEPDDGLFDVVLIGDITKGDFVTTSPKLYRGGHVGHPRIEILRSPWVAVTASRTAPVELDGEEQGRAPVRFDVVAGALRLRVPV